MVNQNWHVAPVMLLCQATTSYSKIFRPENCRNPTTLLHWHESHFNSKSRKWNNFSLSKILTLELQHKHPWTTVIEHSLFLSVCGQNANRTKCQPDIMPTKGWHFVRTFDCGWHFVRPNFWLAFCLEHLNMFWHFVRIMKNVVIWVSVSEALYGQ